MARLNTSPMTPPTRIATTLMIVPNPIIVFPSSAKH